MEEMKHALNGKQKHTASLKFPLLQLLAEYKEYATLALLQFDIMYQ